MGHNLLPTIPTGAAWQAVVGLVAEGASAAEVAGAAARAADRDLSRAADDPVFVESVRLLAALPPAAAAASPAEALRAAGLQAGSTPSLSDLLGAVSHRLDEVAYAAGRGSDLAELCRRALISTLARRIGDRLPGLVPAEPGDVLDAAASFRSPDAFASLARDFFGDLTSQSLSNWVDRILPTMVGRDRRFESASAKAEFARALDLHVLETTRIIHEFSIGWYAKALRDGAPISSDRARRFGGYAFTKVRAELERRSGADA